MRKYPTKIGQGEVKVKMTMKLLPQARVKEHGTAEVRRAEDIHRQADAVETEIKIGRGENGHLMTGNQYGEIQVATKNTINIRNGKRKRKSEKHLIIHLGSCFFEFGSNKNAYEKKQRK